MAHRRSVRVAARPARVRVAGRAGLSLVLLVCGAHCGASHERGDAGALDASPSAHDARPPISRADATAPRYVTVARPDSPDAPPPDARAVPPWDAPDPHSADAPDARSADAPGTLPDAPDATTDAGHVYSIRDCDALALGGSALNGSPCVGGPWFCGIYDCFCSGAWPRCTADDVVSVAGRCDPAGCAVPGAWNDCAAYVAAGAPTRAQCDPRYFATCTVADGICARHISCYPLDGIVFEERRCP